MKKKKKEKMNKQQNHLMAKILLSYPLHTNTRAHIHEVKKKMVSSSLEISMAGAIGIRFEFSISVDSTKKKKNADRSILQLCRVIR